MKTRNVLIFPAGTEIGLEIFHALEYCKEVRLFGAGQDVSNHARFLFTTYYPLPSVHEPGWLEELSRLCEKLQIDYIFPAHDDVIVALSKSRAAIPAAVLCPEADTCVITRSKSSTYGALCGKVRVPKLFAMDDTEDAYAFPLLVKPDRGQGSFGVTKVNNYLELSHAVATVPEPIICEYLPGGEYTVDCFSDRDRGVLFAKARSRRRTRNGISVNTVSEELPDARQIAETIHSVLGMRGAWFYQLKESREGEPTLLEIAPRIAGAMAAHRVLGVNFPLLSIFEYERLPIRILTNHNSIELDRALENLYRHDIEFDSLYVDLDDTVVCKGSVNAMLLTLIFQVIAQNKPVILLTRHAGDVMSTLSKFRLAGVFDRVVHLRNGEPKSSYISGDKPILVDDSFSERMEVSQKLGIPTFDCSMIEILLNS